MAAVTKSRPDSPGTIADPLTADQRQMRALLRPVIAGLEARVERLEATIRDLTATLAYERRLSMPQPIRDAHAVELLDRAAREAEGETGDEIIADTWSRWMGYLDGEMTDEGLAQTAHRVRFVDSERVIS